MIKINQKPHVALYAYMKRHHKSIDPNETYMTEKLMDFTRELSQELTEELHEFGLDMCEAHDLSSMYRESMSQALCTMATDYENAGIAVIFRTIYSANELQWPSRVSIRYSTFDQSFLASYFNRYYEHWNLQPWLTAVTYNADYTAIKQGTLPIVVTLGSYHSSSDVDNIIGVLPLVKKATIRAVVSFLFPYFRKVPTNATPEELDFCIRSTGSLEGPVDAGLIRPEDFERLNPYKDYKEDSEEVPF